MPDTEYTIKLAGSREMVRRIQRMSDAAIGRHLEDAAAAGAGVITEEMRRRAPKRTGRAARSIHYELVKSAPDSVTYAIGPGKQGWYLKFHEFGTVYMTARPFARPAFEEMQDPAVSAARRKLWEDILGAIK